MVCYLGLRGEALKLATAGLESDSTAYWLQIIGFSFLTCRMNDTRTLPLQSSHSNHLHFLLESQIPSYQVNGHQLSPSPHTDDHLSSPSLFPTLHPFVYEMKRLPLAFN